MVGITVISMSYRFLQGLAERHGVRGRDLAAHCVGVAAAAARPCGMVIASLAQGEAQLGRRIAAQAGQAKSQEGHGSPAGAGMGRGTGARPISTVVLVICRAVVEKTFYTAQASAILYGILSRAQASLATGPAGR